MKNIKGSTKRLIYLVLFDLFGAELGAFIAFIIWYVCGATGDYWVLNCTWYTILGALIVIGMVFGLWAGPVAWQKIYVEGVRGKKYLVK